MTLTAPAAPPAREGRADAAALLESNRRRRRVRRWIAIASIPFVLAGLAVTGKIVSMYAFAYQTVADHTLGDYSGSLAAASALDVVNIFEPFVAPYDIGTEQAMLEQLDDARTSLERAVELAPGLQVCAPMINLALVIERQGDAAIDEGDGAAAIGFYREALGVRADTPVECESTEAEEQSPDPNRDMTGTLSDLEERLRDKLETQEQQQQGGGGGDEDEEEDPQGGEGEDDSPLTDEQQQDLEDQLGQGAEERQENDQEGDGEGGGGAEKPW